MAAEKVREYYYITAEQMKDKVNDYIPLLAKTEWVQLVAPKCFDRLEMTASMGDDEMAIPPMYKESADLKSRYLMGFFVRLYLNAKWEIGEDEDEWLIPYEEYDKWMGGHIFSQIEKFKSDKELKDKCFNVLAEYKDVEKRLNSEIFGMLQAQNDAMSRQLAVQQMTMTPEAINAMLEGLNQAKDALEEYKKEREDE